MVDNLDGVIKIKNPATGENLTDIYSLKELEVKELIERSGKAFETWSKYSPRTKAKKLYEIADLIEKNITELAEVETLNTGKPISDSISEISEACYVFRYFAGLVENHRGATIPVEGGIDITFYEPFGVVGAIVPWNFPFLISAWKIAPALACGNSIIVKPAELTPLSILKFKELLSGIDFLQDLILVACGFGETVGRALVDDPRVAKISFTGSTEVGKEIVARSANNLKRVTLELGGKSAMVVFSDADLEKAASLAPYAVFQNAGQDCCARSRILIEESVFDMFLELFVKNTSSLKVGDPMNKECEMGPLISQQHLQKVKGFLDHTDRINVIYQRNALEKNGNYFGPVVVSVADTNLPIVKEEIFGPICVLVSFKGDEQAAEMANDTIYGLSGSIWTKDVSRAIKMAKAIKSGTLSVNSNTSVRTNTPFGGFKQSGYGKELSMEAMSYYSELKNVFISTD